MSDEEEDHTTPGPSSAAPRATSAFEDDLAVFTGFLKTGALSPGMQRWMAIYIRITDLANRGQLPSPEDQEALTLAAKGIMLLPSSRFTPESTPAALNKRPRTQSVEDSPPPSIVKRTRAQSLESDSSPRPAAQDTTPSSNYAQAAQLLLGDSPQPQRMPRRPASPAEGPRSSGGALPAGVPSADRTSHSTATSYADIASPRRRMELGTDSQEPPRQAATEKTAPTTTEARKYPPIIVERLPQWSQHFRAISATLKRPPNARPMGEGVKFTPADAKEYRVVQAYLGELEKTTRINWFSYTLPEEREIKVAIRGLPANTTPEEIGSALAEQGFEAEYVKPIRARGARPGCIFFVRIKRTPNARQIYDVTELLLMPGVKVEAWRGKKGPAQCHRCQTFRHSSQNCHREAACVRCGGPHQAFECPRSKEDAPTCANCGGAHPANSFKCPVLKREARNKRAGTIARTGPPRKPEEKQVEEATASTLMAPANVPTDRTKPLPSRKGGKKKKKTKGAAPQAAAAPKKTTEASPGGGDILTTLRLFKDALEAIQSGQDPATAMLRSMTSLLSNV